MATTGAIGGTGSSSSSQINPNDGLRGLDLDQFLKLMITELQNQDPLNPMENSEILGQISQIREIGATNKLTETLDSVLLGQTLSNASSLIGKHVEALTEDGKTVKGVVDKVTIAEGIPQIHIGDDKVPLKNVREIKSDLPATAAA